MVLVLTDVQYMLQRIKEESIECNDLSNIKHLKNNIQQPRLASDSRKSSYLSINNANINNVNPCKTPCPEFSFQKKFIRDIKSNLFLNSGINLKYPSLRLFQYLQQCCLYSCLLKFNLQNLSKLALVMYTCNPCTSESEEGLTLVLLGCTKVKVKKSLLS